VYGHKIHFSLPRKIAMTNERDKEPEPQQQQGGGGSSQQAENEKPLPGRDPEWGQRGQRQGEHKQERTQKQ
jgi:hypothetical protein